MFYAIFVKLCKERNVSASFVMKEIGLNKSNATFWKRGSVPKGDTLQKLAEYFGVSVDYLLGKSTEKTDSKRQSIFEQYLESIGYTTTKNPPEAEGFWDEETDENGDTQQVWVEYQEPPPPTVTIRKGQYAVTFTEEGYQRFIDDVRKSVDFQIWDKSGQQQK